MNRIFGNWQVTNEGIEWIGGGFLTPYKIDRDSMFDEIDFDRCYDWILHLTEKTWMTKKDAYDLNDSLRYAQNSLNIPFDYEVWENTLARQQEILKDKGDSEDEITIGGPVLDI